MNRLNRDQVFLIKQLNKRNYSLNYISNKLKIPKSVVYYWSSKFIGKKIQPVKFDPNMKEELGELIGIFASDGTYIKEKNYGNKIRIFLSEKEYEYSKKIRKLFKKVFGKNGNLFPNKNYHVILIQIYGKEIVNIFQQNISWEYGKKTYTVELKRPIKYYTKEFLKGYLRGLFMGDGWVSKKSTGFGSTSFGLIKNFNEILELFKIKYYFHDYKKPNRKRFYLVTIPVSEKQKFYEIFKIRKMLPTGISG